MRCEGQRRTFAFDLGYIAVLGNTPATQLVTYTLLKRAMTLLNILLRNSLLYSNITQEYRKILYCPKKVLVHRFQ